MKKSSLLQSNQGKQNPVPINSESTSNQHRSAISSEVERARHYSLFGIIPPSVSEMKALCDVLISVQEMLTVHQDEMFLEHKLECIDRIQEIQKIHDGWLVELKRNKSWNHEDIKIRVRSNLEKNRVRYVMATDALRRLYRSADDLKSKISSVEDEDFRSQVSEWLSNTESCIDNTERYIRTLEERIERDEERLRQR